MTSHFVRRACLPAALLAATACASEPGPSPVDLPVAGMQIVPPTEYGAASALAAGGGSAPEIALAIVGPFEGGTQHIIQVNEGVEAPSSARVTVLRDGLLDDSVRSERWDITLGRTSAGVWRIDAVKRAWRCRRGGSPDRFESAPCP